MRPGDEIGIPILFGACGFDHPDWSPAFYPGHLPQEWRLAFYANHYAAVLLGERLWRDVTRDTLRAWVHQTDPSFRMVLESPRDTGTETDVTERIGILAPRLAGFVAPGPHTPDPGGRLVRELTTVAGAKPAGRILEIHDLPDSAWPALVQELAAPGRAVRGLFIAGDASRVQAAAAALVLLWPGDTARA